MDTTRTYTAHVQSNARRVDKKVRAAQQRLADKSFSEFVRQHNAQREGGQR